MTTIKDPVTAIRREQEMHGREMLKREGQGNEKRYHFKKEDRKFSNHVKNGANKEKRFEGHERELNEAVKQGKNVIVRFTDASNSPACIDGKLLSADKFAIKVKHHSREVWVFKHALTTIEILSPEA